MRLAHLQCTAILLLMICHFLWCVCMH
uniref:Uncharacterized protein n=1 Tax=Anguilla anguilla TaxID=7936 RepID=A0A0E9TP69_ANGAN